MKQQPEMVKSAAMPEMTKRAFMVKYILAVAGNAGRGSDYSYTLAHEASNVWKSIQETLEQDHARGDTSVES